MRCYREPPIPQVEVVVVHPGETRETIDDPAAWGDRDSCREYIYPHNPPRGCKFDLRYIESGRLCSYMIDTAHAWKMATVD